MAKSQTVEGGNRALPFPLLSRNKSVMHCGLSQGLHAIAEVGRVQAAQLHAKRCGEKVPDGCGPVIAMDGHEDLTRYAGALLWLGMAHEQPEE